MKLETLSKIDSKGKVREWDCEIVDNQDGTAIIRIVHGLKDGQKITRDTLITSGKNIGKANETTVLEQAESEARSKWEKQRDKGYATNRDTGYSNQESSRNLLYLIGLLLKKNYRPLPMLAHRYDKFSHKIQFPAYVQPKLDGIRCMGSTELKSRKNKTFTSLPHINNDVICAINKISSNINWLDGELYSDTLSFQEITSIVRKQDPEPGYDKIEYHVYDCILPYGGHEKFQTFEFRLDAIKKIDGMFPSIKIVETVIVNDQKELMDYVASCVAKGYEGGIVRNANGLYEIDKRSYDLQKIKFFNDGEFEIVGGKQDKDGGAVFSCRCGNTTFDVRPEGTLAQRQEYWQNLQFCLGKFLTVRYFEMTTSSDPVPRFPVGVSIRDYE